MFIIIRHSSEISLKSDIVRKKFERRLAHNIRAALAQHAIEYELTASGSRLFLRTDDERATDLLGRVFGISTYSVIEHTSAPSLAAMKETALNYQDLVKGKSFCVRVKRFLVPDLTSPQVEKELGATLYPYASKVDLTHPETKIHVELRRDGAYFYSKALRGAGGLPLGIEGKALCLMSGGFDSAVAAWQILKRGVALDFVFYNLAGSANLRSTLKVAKELSDRWCYGTSPHFYWADFTKVATEITRKVDRRFPQVVLKRCMYKGASLLAKRLPGISALVTGESIGQVSSQTLQNLAAIESASSLMVLRPIVGFDKEEIVQLSYRIGTGLLSASVKEYCQISQSRPITKATPARALREETLLDPTVLEEAVTNMQLIELEKLDLTDYVMDHLFTDEISGEAIVIDCRSEEHYKEWHFPGALNRTPEEILSKISTYNKKDKFILYCPYGTQTALLAEKMQAQGFDAKSFRGGTKALKTYFEKRLMEAF
jgi:thiamine biosynthesis protein ThiI